MKKRGKVALILSTLLVIILISGIFLYFSLFKNPSNSKIEQLSNPIDNLSPEQAKIAFNETFVKYILFQIKAYNLHNPPLSQETPKIEFQIEEDTYHAIIKDNQITVYKEEIDSEDIIIKTDKDEAIKMINNKEYIQDSFSSGKSTIELVSSKTTLFAKGYLNLYEELTQESITGNIIKIYSS